MSTPLTPPRSPAGLSRLLSGTISQPLSPLSVEALDGTLSKKAAIAASPRRTKEETATVGGTGQTIEPLSLSSDTSPNYGPLGHRPSLIRLSSGARAQKAVLALGSPVKSLSTPQPQPRSLASGPATAPVASPQSIDDLEPLMVGPPGKAFETGFQQIYIQNELLQQRKERIRQKVLRTTSVAGLQNISPDDDLERERFRMEALKRMRSEMMMTVGQPSKGHGAAAAREDAVDEAIEAASGAATPLIDQHKPDFARSLTEPVRIRRHKTQNSTSASASAQPLTLAYKSEAATVAAAAHAEAVAAQAAQAEVARQTSASLAFEEDEDEQKGDQESANIPSPAANAIRTASLSRTASKEHGGNGNGGPVFHSDEAGQHPLEIRLPDAAVHESAIPYPNRSPSSTPSSSRRNSKLLVLNPTNNSAYNVVPHSQTASPQPSPKGSRQSSRQPSPTRPLVGLSAPVPSGLSVGQFEVSPLMLQRPLASPSSATASNNNNLLSPVGSDRGGSTNGSGSGTNDRDRYFPNQTPRSSANGNGHHHHRVGSRDPSPQPQSSSPKKHVIFREDLCTHNEHVPQSRSITPVPLYREELQDSRGKNLGSNSPLNPSPKSVLKKPASHHVSLTMPHVVKQVMEVNHLGANIGEVVRGGTMSPMPNSPVPFSLHAPYASPAALLQLQIALFHDAIHLDAYCTTLTRTGSILIKYNQSGKPMKRWFYVMEDSNEIKLCWSAPKTSKSKPLWEVNPNGLGYCQPGEEGLVKEQFDKDGKPILQKQKHKSASSSSTSSSILPAFTIGKWKFNQDRSRSLLEVSGIHYGPYYSANFCRFLDKMDSATGKPWLCFSIQFKDRTIDLVCSNEHEVTAWFLGLQAQAPQTCYHMTRGMILWQRLIMKLNYYGLDQIKRVFAKRASLATHASAPVAAVAPMQSPPQAPLSLAQRDRLYGNEQIPTKH